MRSLHWLLAVLLVACTGLGSGSSHDDDDDDEDDDGGSGVGDGWGEDSGGGLGSGSGSGSGSAGEFYIPDYVALDGHRSWEYFQEGTDWMLRVDKTSSADVSDRAWLSYLEDETDVELFSIEWGSNEEGVWILGDNEEQFDSPIQIATPWMSPGDTVASGGEDSEVEAHTSTFVGLEDCPNHWVEDWECVVFEISTLPAGAQPTPFAGRWAFAHSWGPSTFQLELREDEEPWVLTQADWSAAK